MSDEFDRPMSDTTSPDEDELVSAVLDGDATEDERARVLAEPRLRARLTEFERVRDAVGDVPPVDDAARDAAIAGALDAAAHDAVVIDLEKERRRRRVMAIVAVAAAVLVFGPLLAITLTRTGTEEDHAATAPVSEAAEDATAGAVDDEAAPSSTVPPTGEAESAAPSAAAGAVYVGDLGPLGSGGELVSSVRTQLEARRSAFALRTAPSGPSSTVATPPAADRASTGLDRCAAGIASSEPGLGTLVETATGTDATGPVLVYVFQPADASPATVVVTRANCELVARFTV